MTSLRRIWALAAVSAGVLGIVLSLSLGGAFGTAAATGASPAATPAAATSAGASASAIFGCRASLVRVSIANSTVLEPAVANSATTPCSPATSAVGQENLALGGVSMGTAGPAGEFTDETGALGSSTSPAATALSDISALNLNLGGYTLSVAGPVESQATVECSGTKLADQGSSDLSALTLSGPGLPAGGEQLGTSGPNQTLSLPAPLNTLFSIEANEQILGANSLTERVLDIKLLASNIEVVVGEATATVPNTGVCAGNTPGGGSGSGSGSNTTTVTVPGQTVTSANGQTITQGGTVTTITGPSGTVALPPPSGSVPATLNVCTPGSELDPTTGSCVIFLPGGGTIFVSKPFKGPQGGTVMSIPEAKAKGYHSPCLSGPGPKFVIVVTKPGIKAYGTPRGDRILGIGARERIWGLNGDDCIDDQGGNSKVVDGNGKDRLYVIKGSNRVISGNGRDTVHGGKGKNWVTVGTGRDIIYAGTGYSRIDAYGNHKFIWGGKNGDRIWTNSVLAQISCTGHKKGVVFARPRAAKWAKGHGCVKVGVIP